MPKFSATLSSRPLFGGLTSLFFFVVPYALAQVTSFKMAGQVRDTTGRLLPGVNVVLVVAGGIVPLRAATTATEGVYEFQDLPAGSYLLRARKMFKTVNKA